MATTKIVNKNTVHMYFKEFMEGNYKNTSYEFIETPNIENSNDIVFYNVNITIANRDVFVNKLKKFLDEKQINIKDIQKTYRYNPNIKIIKLNTKYMICINPIKKSPTHYEDELLIKVNNTITDMISHSPVPLIPILFQNKIYYINELRKVPKKTPAPKADLFFVNTEGKACLWISHKNGRKPEDFQQWSGVSPLAGTVISEHEEVVQFYNNLCQSPFVKIKNDLKEKEFNCTKHLKRPIKNKHLKGLAIYGNDYKDKGNNVLGENNVAYVIQCDNIIFQKTSKTVVVDGYRVRVYEITVSDRTKIHENGQDMPKEYEPILLIRNASDNRGFKDIKKCRPMIYTASGDPNAVDLFQEWNKVLLTNKRI